MIATQSQVMGTDADTTLTREQLVEQIARLNPTAGREFLAGFERRHLSEYLRHLLVGQEPRGRSARWIPNRDAPAISRWAPTA